MRSASNQWVKAGWHTPLHISACERIWDSSVTCKTYLKIYYQPLYAVKGKYDEIHVTCVLDLGVKHRKNCEWYLQWGRNLNYTDFSSELTVSKSTKKDN